MNGQWVARVFYGGTRFNPARDNCVSSFDSVLFALQAATGNAAYDLSSGGDDRYVTMINQRVNAIGVTGGQLVVDTGLEAQNPPPPPAPIVVGPPAPSTLSNVTVGSKVAGTDPVQGRLVGLPVSSSGRPFRGLPIRAGGRPRHRAENALLTGLCLV